MGVYICGSVSVPRDLDGASVNDLMVLARGPIKAISGLPSELDFLG
jgi:hypothetical protein